MGKWKIAGAAAGILLTALLAAAVWSGTRETLPDGVTVSGFDASGLTAEQFREALLERTARLLSTQAELSAPNAGTRTTTLKALGVTTNAESLAAEAARIFDGPLWERALRRWQWRGRTLTLEADADPSALAAEAKRLWPEMHAKQPVDARRVILPGDRITYTPEEPALRVNGTALRTALLQALLSAEDASEGHAALPDGPLPLPDALRPDSPLLADGRLRLAAPVDRIAPRVTVAELKAQGIERVIASYSTSFATSGAGRKHNIAKTASVVHDRLLAPGDIFDYGKIIEETGKKFGFREAPVILNGKMVPGVGGGICQVSTTLYNAVLLAGLDIVERRNHSLPVSYAPLGRDATFAEGYINFKFRNSTGAYLLIRTTAANGVLTVKLFGSLDPSVTYEIRTVKLKTIAPDKKYVRNPSLPAGSVELLQRGKPGYVVETYRVKKVNGKAVSEERISRDLYKAQPALYASNSGKESSGDRVPKRREPILEDGVRGPAFR